MEEVQCIYSQSDHGSIKDIYEQKSVRELPDKGHQEIRTEINLSRDDASVPSVSKLDGTVNTTEEYSVDERELTQNISNNVPNEQTRCVECKCIDHGLQVFVHREGWLLHLSRSIIPHWLVGGESREEFSRTEHIDCDRDCNHTQYS